MSEMYSKMLFHVKNYTALVQQCGWGSPGFTKQSINFLTKKVASSTYPVFVNLILDEMALHEHVQFDGQQFVGGTDLGVLGSLHNETVTDKDALVFMVVAVNNSWKLPVGYFLIAGLNAEERASLVKECVNILQETGVKVTSITCDAPKVLVSMMNKLGATIKGDSINTEVYQEINIQNIPIHIIHDMCHCIKTVRNSWASIKVLKNGKGDKIEWKYIIKLVNLASDEQLRCANKLTDKHVNFHNHKMKVNLAAQVFSRSVAKSLKFCREVLKLSEYKDSGPTEEFLLVMNDIFDILNSRNPNGLKLQGPLSISNQCHWTKCLRKQESTSMDLQMV